MNTKVKISDLLYDEFLSTGRIGVSMIEDNSYATTTPEVNERIIVMNRDIEIQGYVVKRTDTEIDNHSKSIKLIIGRLN